jgi:Protein of unknown function (DUF3147)
MIVQLNLSSLHETRWYEYLVRFALGGAMTVIAGLIAARFGPIVGGLFLAFPAIFPASATLIEKHVRETQGGGPVWPARGAARKRLPWTRRARRSAASGLQLSSLSSGC